MAIPSFSRRAVLRGGIVTGAALLALGGAGAWMLRRPFDGTTLTPPEAHAAAVGGRMWLVDIRRPDEWAATGIGEGALAIDMRRADFTVALDAATQAAPARPMAFICARGVRSSQLTARLQAAGREALIDVPEGMLGSRAGPGWIARGLPVRAPGAAGA